VVEKVAKGEEAMTLLKCVYCGGPVVKTPEGELVCSVCGSVQPSGVVSGIKGAISRASDGASIEEFELPREYIEAKKRAIKEWLKEQYVKAITELEEAHYGWMWYYAAVRKGNKDLRFYLTEVITMLRLTKIILFVHKLVARCDVPHPVSEKKLVSMATHYGLRTRRRTRIKDNYRRYKETDIEILVDTLDIINTLKKLHCEKHCGGACGKSKGRTSRSNPAPLEADASLLETALD